VGTEAQPTRTRIAALAAIVIGAGLFASVLASAERAAAASNCARVAAPSGSDTGAGTVESPFATPQRLVDSLAPGQTGCFRAGTYSFATLTLETAGITLAPYDSEAVTLAGAIKALPGAANSVIEGMTLNGSSSTDSKIGPKIYASGFTLRGNEVTNDHTEICVLVTSYYDAAPPRGVLIERNRIHDCGALPSTNMDHGIYLSAAVNPIVRDNWIYSNADRGIQQYPDAHGAQITGNVIAANGYGVNFSGTGSEVTSDATVAGNIVVDSSLGYNAYSGGDGPDGTNNFFRDNCVHAASGASGIESNARSFSAAGNLTATPGFVNPAAGDYRLRSDSPCLAKYTGTMSLDGVDPSRRRKSGRPKLKANRSVHRGGWVRLRGRVPAGLLSQPTVVIERRRNGDWQRLKAARIRSDRRFKQRLRVRRAQVLRLRATLAGNRHSRVVRVKVRRPKH
jgi:Right handed beta helix region